MLRAILLLAGWGGLLAGSGVHAEEDFLEGKWTALVHLSQPTGGAKLGSLTETAVVIGAKVSPPKQTREDWLDELPTLYGKWKPYPVGDDKGSAGGSGNGFRLVAMGGDLWGKSDKCYQILTPVVGDFSITCQVTWEKANDDNAKAGIIFREGTDPGSASVAMVNMYSKKECRLQVREKAGTDTKSRGGAQSAASVVILLERQGAYFRCGFTRDGKTWFNRGTGGKFSPSGYVGFVVASKDGKSKATANFAVMSGKGLATEEGNIVMLEKDEYSVVESGKAVSLTARRVGDGKGPLKVPWVAKSGTAAAGSDFIGETGDIEWKDSETGPKKFVIPIRNNFDVEKDKVFSVELGKPAEGNATLGSKQARVNIIDDDGPGKIRFQSVVTCAPDSKTPVAMVNVIREHGKKGDVEVSYQTRAGSAKPGDKYKDVSGTLAWADGDDKPKTIKVPILWPELVAANTEDLLVDNMGKKPVDKKAEAKKAEDAKKAANEEE